MTEDDILHENGITHAKRVASIGFAGEEGLRRAIAEADRRSNAVNPAL